jgi:hypothetical protein
LSNCGILLARRSDLRRICLKQSGFGAGIDENFLLSKSRYGHASREKFGISFKKTKEKKYCCKTHILRQISGVSAVVINVIHVVFTLTDGNAGTSAGTR